MFQTVLPVDGEQQGEGSDGLFSTRQIVHRHEAFPRRHTVIVDAAEVRLIWVLCAQNGLEHTEQDLVIYGIYIYCEQLNVE